MFDIIFGCLFALLVLHMVLYGIVIHLRLPRGTSWFPGPKGLPGIGRVWDIPRTHSYKRFKAWNDRFGSIYQINIFGHNHLWISSDKVARDLLVEKSSIFSDRPSINNLESSKDAPEYLPLLGHNDVWKRQRRFVHGFMSASQAEQYKRLPLAECKQYLVDLLLNPSNVEEVAESFTGRIISRLAFGDVRWDQDIRRHSHALLGAISPAANLPNIIPQLRHLPAFLSPWKTAERARHERERQFFIQMFNNVKESIEAGHDQHSYMRTFIENREKTGMSDLEGAYTVGMIGLAGILTTASALITYTLAMCLHPEWQQRLQEEIDRVCGDRMPTPQDGPDLPVLRAVIKEVMRWRPVTPSSIPHESTADHVYEGHFIPKGTHVHPNQWAITRDASVYPDPETYNPARWLEPHYPSYKEPLTKYPTIQGFTTFGYGRRICMGMDLVEQELIVGMGAMAWAFDISKKRDARGAEIPVPSHDYTSLLISRPKPFQMELTARSAERSRQIWAQYDQAVRGGEIGGVKARCNEDVSEAGPRTP